MAHALHHQLGLGPLPVNPVVPSCAWQGKSVVPPAGPSAPRRELLRQAIDTAQWKHDALAAALNVTASYLSKMLAGEKAITLRHIDALPDDVTRVYAQLCAEQAGLLVVVPSAAQDAMKQLVAGLVGVLAGGAR